MSISRYTKHSFLLSLAIHIIFLIVLSLFLHPSKMPKMESIEASIALQLSGNVETIPLEERKPAPRPPKETVKPVMPPRDTLSLLAISKEASSKTSRGVLVTKKPQKQDDMGETIIKMGQDMRELQIGAGVSVKGRERILGGSGKGEEILPTAGVGRGLEVGEGSVGLGGGVGEITEGKGSVDFAMKKVERLAPFVQQRGSKQEGLSMVGKVGVADTDDVLANVTKDMMLDQTGFGVPELPKGEPGGIVVGRGKDIRGYLRFPRVDCSMTDREITAIFFSKAITNLIKWINSQTKIKVDINVEGGGIQLTDSNLFKSPVVFLLGMDSVFADEKTKAWIDWSALTIPPNLPEPKISSRLTDIERKRLREYLIDKGGLLVIDVLPKTVRGGEYSWSRRMKGELRTILPEYMIERIPNNHEIYHCYYELSGPPPGCSSYVSRSGTGFVYARESYLEGISIDGRLAVIYCQKGYSWVMSGYYFPPQSTFRLMTNIIVYSLTHSGISDKSRYAPQKEIQESAKEIPKKPPLIPQPTPSLRP